MNKLRGVNLGGWLVLEKWMTPTVFENTTANDEFSFCLNINPKSTKKLKNFRKKFITKKDLDWIKSKNINALRVPVGYWHFGDFPPFLETASYLDWLMEESKKRDLQIVIDLHAAPGSQNGSDHSGISGNIEWHQFPGHITETLAILERISSRYGGYENLFGIELLNEPDGRIPKEVLQNFYKKGYEIVGKNSNKKVAVIFHDAFNPFGWESFITENQFSNCYLDLHLYQCFSEEDKRLDSNGHLKKAAVDWKNMIEKIQNYVPVLIGEWSRGLDPTSLTGLNEKQLYDSKKAYLKTQLEVFENAAGWFFWNYKIENEAMKNDWSYKDILS